MQSSPSRQGRYTPKNPCHADITNPPRFRHPPNHSRVQCPGMVCLDKATQTTRNLLMEQHPISGHQPPLQKQQKQVHVRTFLPSDTRRRSQPPRRRKSHSRHRSLLTRTPLHSSLGRSIQHPPSEHRPCNRIAKGPRHLPSLRELSTELRQSEPNQPSHARGSNTNKPPPTHV